MGSKYLSGAEEQGKGSIAIKNAGEKQQVTSCCCGEWKVRGRRITWKNTKIKSNLLFLFNLSCVCMLIELLSPVLLCRQQSQRNYFDSEVCSLFHLSINYNTQETLKYLTWGKLNEITHFLVWEKRYAVNCLQTQLTDHKLTASQSIQDINLPALREERKD